MTKVLILTANPTNTKSLKLSEEVRAVKAAWERSPQRHQFEIIVAEAVHPEDFRRTLLEHKPGILHFAGHGSGEDGLALLGNDNRVHLIQPETLTRFFKALQDMFHIDCVVLNACYSEVQANGICPFVDAVVGMSRQIGDQAAQQFSIGFYDTIFAGESIDSAFALGCNAIEMENLPEYLTPVLRHRPQQSQSEDDGGHPLAPNQISAPMPVSSSEQATPELSAQKPAQPKLAVEIPFENLDGQVPLGSPFYVERPPIEQSCYATIQKPAGLIRVKAPRQMGKTSLMSRVVAKGERLGYRTALINLWDRKFLTDIDTFLENFCATLSDALDIEEKIDQFWKKRLGSQKNCSNYLQKYVLKEIATPIVVGLDEVDRIFAYPQLADDFFALLRSWHELGKNDPVWQKLRLVMSHSQEVYIPLNVNRSPFNVGLPIELGAFSRAQVQDLVQRHGLVWSDTDLDRLMKMVDGHPYLVRVALYHIATCVLTLDEVLQTAPTEAGLYEDHLYRHLLFLEENPRLKDAMVDLVRSDRPLRLEPVVSFKLKSMGLAKSMGNELVPLCDLYRLYFGDRLRD